MIYLYYYLKSYFVDLYVSLLIEKIQRGKCEKNNCCDWLDDYGTSMGRC